MQIRCVKCDSLGNVPYTALDKNVRCPRCGNVFKVTQELFAKGSERRRAERLDVDRVDLDFGIVAGTAQVRDMSATGVGFEPPEADVDFNTGDVVNFTLLEGKNPVLKNVQVRITRKGAGFFGGEFENLSKVQLAEIKHFLARQRYEATHKAAEDVELEMDEETIRLKSRGYL